MSPEDYKNMGDIIEAINDLQDSYQGLLHDTKFLEERQNVLMLEQANMRNLLENVAQEIGNRLSELENK